MSITVFFPYSHKDEALRDKLANHLSILRRERTITAWHDRQSRPEQNGISLLLHCFSDRSDFSSTIAPKKSVLPNLGIDAEPLQFQYSSDEPCRKQRTV